MRFWVSKTAVGRGVKCKTYKLGCKVFPLVKVSLTPAPHGRASVGSLVTALRVCDDEQQSRGALFVAINGRGGRTHFSLVLPQPSDLIPRPHSVSSGVVCPAVPRSTRTGGVTTRREAAGGAAFARVTEATSLRDGWPSERSSQSIAS